MIDRLRGTILEKQPPNTVLLEVYGIGYEIHMPIVCFYKLPDVGNEVVLLTQFIAREDTQLLYGFNYQQERVLFRELIKVNGIGPKLALAILSGISIRQLIIAIQQKEITTLVKLPGVGRKMAERLVIEMKDRLTKIKSASFADESEEKPIKVLVTQKQNLKHIDAIEAEAISALISLGYKPQEASCMINRVSHLANNCETLIREALRFTL